MSKIPYTPPSVADNLIGQIAGRNTSRSRFPKKSFGFLAISVLFAFGVIVYFKARDGRLLFHLLDRSSWVAGMLSTPFVLAAIAWAVAAVTWRTKAVVVFYKVAQVVCIALGIWVFVVGVFGLLIETKSISSERPNQSFNTDWRDRAAPAG